MLHLPKMTDICCTCWIMLALVGVPFKRGKGPNAIGSGSFITSPIWRVPLVFFLATKPLARDLLLPSFTCKSADELTFSTYEWAYCSSALPAAIELNGMTMNRETFHILLITCVSCDVGQAPCPDNHISSSEDRILDASFPASGCVGIYAHWQDYLGKRTRHSKMGLSRLCTFTPKITICQCKTWQHLLVQ